MGIAVIILANQHTRRFQPSVTRIAADGWTLLLQLAGHFEQYAYTCLLYTSLSMR